MRLLVLSLLASLLGGMIAAQDKPPAGPQSDEKSKILSTKTTKLFPDPGDKALLETFTISHIGRVGLVIYEVADNTQRVIINGKQQKPYPYIVPAEALSGVRKGKDNKVSTREAQNTSILKWAPDQQKLYYIASTDKGFVVASDGYESGVYDFVLGGYPVFSADSNKWGFLAVRKKECYVVLNGTDSKAYDDVAPGSLVYSPNSQRTAYAARTGNEWTVYVDGATMPAMDGIAEGHPVFSPDSQKLAYVAFSKSGKMSMMVNGSPLGEYDAVAERTVVFSPDSAHLVYAAKLKQKWMLYVDSQSYGPYDALGDEPPVYSRDSKRLAWTARRGAFWYVIQDGAELTIPSGGEKKEPAPLCVDSVMRGTPMFSPDGKQLVVGYRVQKDWKIWSETLGESEKFDEIVEKSLKFTNDSSKLVFVGVRSKMYSPVINMKELKASPEVGPVRISRGETSGTVAYAIKRVRTSQEMSDMRALDPKNTTLRNEYWNIAINGEEINGPYDDVQPFAVTLSPNGTKVAYPARKRNKWALYIDGARRTDELPVWIVFNDSNMMEMVAINDKDGYVFLQEVME